MSSTEQHTLDVEAWATQLTDQLNVLVGQGLAASVDPEVIRRLFAVSLRAYVVSLESGKGGPAFIDDDQVTATEAAVAADQLLAAADLNPFELTMWSKLGCL